MVVTFLYPRKEITEGFLTNKSVLAENKQCKTCKFTHAEDLYNLLEAD